MKLSEILRGIEVKNKYEDREIADVTSDSRLVEKGFVFVCIKGASFDGHSVAAEMLEKGAAAVVCEYDLGLDGQIIVEDTRKALSPICANYFGNPSEKLKLIGLTGTNGKTTTTFLIKQILENTGKKVGLIGTVQNMVGSEVFPAHYTTPDPHELQSLFRKMVDAGCEYCVMEVSSQALAQGRVNGIHFLVGAFTNLTQDHLDYHKTYELVCDKIGRVVCPIPGRFSVYNSLCAVSVALCLGIDFEKAVPAISKSNGVKGRIEVVPPNTDYTLIIDYAHSPDGLENIISSLKEIAKGRVVTVFGCGGDRDRTKRPKMGRIAAQLSDFCVVTSDNPRSEEPSKIIEDILEGMKDTKTPYKVVENRKEAIAWAMNHAKKDDIILLAGKGHETYQILPTGTIHFDEREVVAEVLSQK